MIGWAVLLCLADRLTDRLALAFCSGVWGWGLVLLGLLWGLAGVALGLARSRVWAGSGCWAGADCSGVLGLGWAGSGLYAVGWVLVYAVRAGLGLLGCSGLGSRAMRWGWSRGWLGYAVGLAGLVCSLVWLGAGGLMRYAVGWVWLAGWADGLGAVADR